MGVIQSSSSGESIRLKAEHSIGRAATCALRLPDTHVSSQHAIMRWTGYGWFVRDLGSINGTYVNGTRLKVGHNYPLSKGSRLAFGDQEQTFVLVDVEGPQACAVDVDSGRVILQSGAGLIALPSDESPELLLVRGGDGRWEAEVGAEVRVLVDGELLDLGDRSYRFHEPGYAVDTNRLQEDGLTLSAITVVFRVSRDEEHVDLVVRQGEVEHIIEDRSHFYLLATLARARVKDETQGIPSASAGWLSVESLCDGLGLNPNGLNVQVFRIRQDFGQLEVLSSNDIIRRRSRAKQLRIGIPARRLQVVVT